MLHELQTIRRNLDSFLAPFEACIKTQPSRDHLRTYLSGQISHLPRKSIEPIALEAQVAPRTLQDFLCRHCWDHEAVRQTVQTHVMQHHADEHAIALIDETSFAKKGDQTAGVQRQYCGATGKIDNCVVTVHLGYVTGNFHALVDSDLFLPEATWAEQPEQRRKAGIPAELTHRTKGQIALDLLRRSIDNGMRFQYLVADEAYGSARSFRQGVAQLGLSYMVEITCKLTGWKMPAASSAVVTRKPRRVDELWPGHKMGGCLYHIKDTDKGPAVWEARLTRFCLVENKEAGEEGWLIVARNVIDHEMKYFFSNAPATAAAETILHICFSRWHIERIFEDGKQEVGLDHFEVRRYKALQRHLILSMVSLLFLVEETDRLREKKPVVERVAGATGGECAA